jgi:glycosyltransferase involved in cell wall biosynthesis
MDERNFEKQVCGNDRTVIAIMCGYNEQDIVVSTINAALKQGMHVYYVDDNSTDDTRELVQRYYGKNDCVGYAMMDTSYREHNESDKSWNLKRQLEYKAKLARTQFRDYQWLLHMDCDEVYECKWAPTVAQGLLLVPPEVGKINCDVHDYFPSTIDTREWSYDAVNKEPMTDITSVLSVYRKRNDFNTYFRFLRISEQLDLDLGHRAKTLPDVPYTQNIIMHHYPYRSKALAESKVAKDRLPRIAASDVQSGIGWHYRLVNGMRLPVDMKTANQNVLVFDGRYVTYYLTR